MSAAPINPTPHAIEVTVTHPATGMTYRRFPGGTWWVLDIVRQLDDVEIAELALEPVDESICGVAR